MKPPVEAPTSSARRPRDVEPERVERVGELDPAPRDERRRRQDLELDVLGHQLPGLRGAAAFGQQQHLARDHRRGRTRARLEHAALREQAVEPDRLATAPERYVIDVTVIGAGTRDDEAVIRIKPLSLTAHGAIELMAGIVLMLSPAILDYGAGALIASVALGAVLTGTALGLTANRLISAAAHGRFDSAFLLATALAALIMAVSGQLTAAVVFSLVVMLLAVLGFSTRYAPAG